jgi:hypothetical protein
MKLWAAFFAATILCLGSLAQEAPSSSAPAPNDQKPEANASAQADPGVTNSNLRIAPGSVIPVQLTKTIDAKKAKTGDPVEAKVVQDLKAANGDLVVPKDTKVLGRVTEAQARTKEQKESQLGISFDHAVMKSRGDVQLPVSIQAVIASPNSANTSPGNEPSGAPTSASNTGGGSPGNASGRSPSMGTGTAPQSSPAPDSGSPTGSQAGTAAHEPITGNTQGVVGISNLKLATNADAAQGSVLTSDKNNVKLESGTFLLLRVSQ